MAALCSEAQRAEIPEPRWTLSRILRAFLPDCFARLLPALAQRKRQVLWKLGACGTPELGYHVYACPHCARQHWKPASCGDRHCPSCLAAKSRQWLEQQMQSLLPITYYHCVFTLPSELYPLVFANQRQLYRLLFDSAAQALLEFGRHRLKGDIGVTAVLHTWGQQLNFHPHLHCIVTGGALRADGRQWRSPRQGKFLFPREPLAVLFRGKFLAGLRRLLEEERAEEKLHYPAPALRNSQVRRRWVSELYRQRWQIHLQRPFGGPQQVLSYLANYTHRVALSNRRILSVDAAQQTVTFSYRDYRHNSQVKPLTLSAYEFIRRFSFHLLPRKLVRIRHYGVLGNNRRQRDIETARRILERRGRRQPPAPAQLAPEPQRCPWCNKPGVKLVAILDAHGRLHPIGKPALCDSS